MPKNGWVAEIAASRVLEVGCEGEATGGQRRAWASRQPPLTKPSGLRMHPLDALAMNINSRSFTRPQLDRRDNALDLLQIHEASSLKRWWTVLSNWRGVFKGTIRRARSLLEA